MRASLRALSAKLTMWSFEAPTPWTSSVWASSSPLFLHWSSNHHSTELHILFHCGRLSRATGDPLRLFIQHSNSDSPTGISLTWQTTEHDLCTVLLTWGPIKPLARFSQLQKLFLKGRRPTSVYPPAEHRSSHTLPIGACILPCS